VSLFFAALVGALVATNQPAAISNLVSTTTGVSVSVPDPNDPTQKELDRLMQEDDAAQAEVDGWIRENRAFAAKGAGIPDAELNRRILKRFEIVRKGYEDLIRRHPDNADARIAFASFLHDIGDGGEVQQLEKACQLNPKDAAGWNNLGNYYGEYGPVKKAFRCYERAIELNASEPVYYQNFGTAVCMLRKDAREYYGLTEPQVFDKALALYVKALSLDPGNFPLATDLASTYYIIRPLRLEDALQAWTNALRIAHDDIEREGVYVHLARLKLNAGRFAEARAHLDAVTNPMYADLRQRLDRNLEEKQKAASAPATNSPPVEPGNAH
jgi:tetratricopeptide (TPR) repeat protein